MWISATPTVSSRSAAMSSAMRSDFSKASRCGSMSAAALFVEAGVVGGGAGAEIAAHHQHAIEALHLEAHLELEFAILVALLRGFAGLEDAPHGLQHVRGDRLRPQVLHRAAGNFFFAAVEAAHRVAADAGKDDAVAAHDHAPGRAGSGPWRREFQYPWWSDLTRFAQHAQRVDGVVAATCG